MYDFAVDTDQISALNTALDSAKTSSESEIEGVFQTLGTFEDTTWSGSSYDNFKSGCEAYHEPMNAIPQVLEAFKAHMTQVADAEPELENSVKSAMDSIE